MTGPGDALYRLLLRAFPPSFRLRHGDQMLAQFQRAARWRSAAGRSRG